MKYALAAMLLAAPAFAAIHGKVVNQTTGKPEPGVSIVFVQPGQDGMKTLGTVNSGATGEFSFDAPAASNGPTLLQATFQGVTYNKMLTPGTPTTGLTVDVYDSTTKRSSVQVSQEMILLQPTGSQLRVNQAILVQDSGKVAFRDPANGTLQFYLPPAAKDQVTVTVNAPGGMPVQRPATPTKQANVYKVDYPIKPGETRFDVSYTLPAATPLTFSSEVLHKEGKTRIVAPRGVTVKGPDIQSLGQEPSTQASIFEVKSSKFSVELEGTGTLNPEGGAGAAAQQGEDTGIPEVKIVPPRVYSNLYWILGLVLATLVLGSVLLSRSGETSGRK